ncbi:hypothetical protein HK096_000839, partial [Nowakowskiella sp. JEL0078]
MTVFYQPILGILLFGLTCGRDGFIAKMKLNQFSCLDSIQIPFSIISLLTIFWFSPLVLVFRALYFNSNPGSHIGRAHGRIDFCLIFVKTVTMIFNAMYSSDIRWRLTIQFIYYNLCTVGDAMLEKKKYYRGRIDPKEKIFWRWTDMELCIRHTLDDVMNKRNIITHEQLKTISQIWEIATEDHKQSTGPHVHMAIYLSAFFDDYDMIQKYTRNATSIEASPDFRFLLFCIRCGVQQQQKNGGTSVQLISDFEKKKYWKTAKDNSRIAEQKLMQAWKYILISRSNLRFLPNYSWEASKAITSANRSFEILIGRFPFDKAAHKAYFRFLIDIKHDTKTAAKIARDIDSDDNMSIEVESSRASSVSSSGMSKANSTASLGLSRSNSNASVTRNIQQAIQKSKAVAVDRNESTIKSVVKQLEKEQMDSLKTLRWTIILSSVFLILVNFIVFFSHIYSQNLWNTRIDWEENVASQGFYLSRIFRDTRRLQISTLKVNPLDRDYAALEWSRTLARDTSALFNITLSTFKNEAIQIYDNQVPLANAINMMIQYGSYIASINDNFGYKISTIPFIEEKALQFLLEYGKMIPKFFEVTVEKKRIEKNVDILQENRKLTIFISVLAVVEFLVFIQLTIPAVHKFRRRQKFLTAAFKIFPKNAIQSMINDKKRKGILTSPNEAAEISQNNLEIHDPVQGSDTVLFLIIIILSIMALLKDNIILSISE